MVGYILPGVIIFVAGYLSVYRHIAQALFDREALAMDPYHRRNKFNRFLLFDKQGNFPL